jgi:hypothetical protein
METPIDYRPILEEVLKGHVPDDLKKLYDHPIRQTVPWLQFPAWARPCDWVEGGHEG